MGAAIRITIQSPTCCCPIGCLTYSRIINGEPESSFHFREIREAVSSLKRHRASGLDNLPPAMFKDGGECLIQCLTRLFTRIWETETVPDNWGESIIVPIFKKGSRSECSNLTPVVTRILASLILRRLIATREASIREEQARFRPGRGCIDHIFTLCQILEQRHAYRRPTILVFLVISKVLSVLSTELRC